MALLRLIVAVPVAGSPGKSKIQSDEVDPVTVADPAVATEPTSALEVASGAWVALIPTEAEADDGWLVSSRMAEAEIAKVEPDCPMYQSVLDAEFAVPVEVRVRVAIPGTVVEAVGAAVSRVLKLPTFRVEIARTSYRLKPDPRPTRL